ncbi:MAG: serine/threonine-protein kinase [Synechocystis sp.]|nr:serine/threonine-protein kinase [Synechocystis sp.]
MSICINPDCKSQHNNETLLFCRGCGSELLIDGRYRTTRQLGSGGFGKTYEVLNHTPNQLFSQTNDVRVLKVLSHNWPKYIELFEREAQVLSQLSHPGIPKVEPDDYFIYHPHNSAEPLRCLVMEKIEGLNLLEYAARRKTVIKQKRALHWLIQLVTILEEVHKHNFFHRDIKPSNIMLRADGHLALIDFGAARQVSASFIEKQGQGQVTGIISAGYTPPEQMHGQAGPQSDFFALGRTFVFLLTGKEPSDFYDPGTDTLRWEQATTEIAPQFIDYLNYLMARLPNQRPRNATEILQGLTNIYQQLYPNDPNAPTPNQNDGRRSVPPPPLPPIKPIAPPTQPLTATESNLNSPPDLSSPPPGYPHPAPMYSSPPPPPSQAPVSASPFPPSFAQGQPTNAPLLPDFIARCQQELAEFVGPMAAIICQRVRNKSNLSPQEFVEQLAQKIPDRQQADIFRKRLNTY